MGRRRATGPVSNPDGDLFVALYYGTRADGRSLLGSNTLQLPLAGATATARLPFGDAVITLVASPTKALARSFAPAVPWIVLALALLFTSGATFLAAWLLRAPVVGREATSESRRLYQTQRQVSETLQRALLPSRLGRPPGTELASLDAGLERLRAAATEQAPLEWLLDDLLARLVPGGHQDDIAAMRAIRWQSAGVATRPMPGARRS